MNDNFNNPNGLNETNSFPNNELNNLNNIDVLGSEEIVKNNVIGEQSPTINNDSMLDATPAVESLNLNVDEFSVTNSAEPLMMNNDVNQMSNNINGEVAQNNFNEFTPETSTFNNFNSMGPEALENTPVSSTTVENYGNVAAENGNGEKRNKSLIALIVVLVLALGAAAGFFAYKYIVMSNPVTIIEKALTALGKETNEAIIEYNKEIKTVLNGKIQNEMSLSLNEYNANLLLKMDMKDKVVSAKADVAIEKEDFLNAEFTFNEEAAYFKLLKDTSNVFMINEDFSEIFELTEQVEEVNPILSNFITYLGESVKENLSKADFEKSKEEISYKGKQVNATRYALTFNANNINPILESYKNKLVNDDKLMSYIADLASESGYDKSEIKEEIVTIIDDMKLSVADEDLEEIKLLIYVKGAELVKISLDDPGARLDLEVYDGLNLVIKPTEDIGILRLTCREDEFSFKFTDNDETEITADFANGKYKVDLKVEEELDVNLTGTYKIDNKNIELTFNTEIMGEKYSGKIISKETISNNIKINVPKNALDIEDEANQATLMEEIQTMPAYILVESLMGSDYEDDYYDDEYYDDYDTDLDYNSEWEF